MERFIAVDSGKFRTKVALYSQETGGVLRFGFRTKADPGSFLDDAIEANTFIAEIGGKCYKMGKGAVTEAALETTKKSEIHRNATLAAIALCTKDGDTVSIAVGCPVKEYESVEKRNAYREYIVPAGKYSVRIKTKSDAEPETRNFEIVYSAVYPELAGVLYLDMPRYADGVNGVIDLGGGTALGAQFDGFEIMHDYSFSCELGGNVLASGLAQELSAECSRITPDAVRRMLTLPAGERCLIPRNGAPEHIEEIRKRSAEITDRYLRDYTLQIRRQCDAKHWSLDFLDLTFIGGTSGILAPYIKEVFGENVYFPHNTEYANAVGFLRRLCAQRLKKIIPSESGEEQRLGSGTFSAPGVFGQSGTEEKKTAKKVQN